MNRAKIYELEKNLTTLKKIKCPPNMKRQLRKAASDWVKISKFEISLEKGKIGDYASDIHKNYHQGQTDMLKIFFNLKDKHEKDNESIKKDGKNS